MRWASPNSPAVSGNRDGRLRPEAIAEWASAPVLPRVPCKKVPPGCRLSGTVPTASRCKKSQGFSAMPSSAYFRRQADICLRLSLIASDEEVSSRLIKMSREYLAKGDPWPGERPMPARPYRIMSRDRRRARSNRTRPAWVSLCRCKPRASIPRHQDRSPPLYKKARRVSATGSGRSMQVCGRELRRPAHGRINSASAHCRSRG